MTGVVAPLRGGRITGSSKGLLRGRGLSLQLGELALVDDLLAEAVGFEGGDMLLAPLAPPVGLRAHTPYRRYSVHDNMAYGRVHDALGCPIDDRRPRGELPIVRQAGLRQRGPVSEALPTGIRAIDALLTLGRGQRIAVAAPAGVGKTTLLRQLLHGAEADAVVVALIGERGREVTEFAEAALDGPGGGRTVIVASTSEQAPALRLRAADQAHAVAASLAADGKSVLLIFDSMTRVAQAQREIGLALGEAAAMGAYPPSAFALIPRLVERCGVDHAGGGAVTAIYTVLAEAGDADDPIVDALRAATDGHIVLSRTLAEQGVYPAIDIGRSLSRTMDAVVSADHLDDARRARRLWSVAEEYRELQAMGVYRAGTDAEADDAMARRGALLALVTQGQGVELFERSRAALAMVLA